MKKTLAFFLFLTVFFCTLCSCNGEKTPQNDKITVVASLFPQYDFARQIAGDSINLTLLLPPGTESHTFDPSPKDRLAIAEADIFVYTGPEMEPWAERIAGSISSETLLILDVSKGISLPENEEEHDHEEEHDDHNHGADPHIWLDPLNARIMVQTLCDALCEKNPDMAEEYKQNAKAYQDKLSELHEQIQDTVKNIPNNTLVFGGRFAYGHFLHRYELEAVTAYESCSEQAEPSVGRIKEVVDYIRANNVKALYYEELSDPKVARSIANQTGVALLLFSTAHSVSKEEFADRITYINIMENNLKNIKASIE